MKGDVLKKQLCGVLVSAVVAGGSAVQADPSFGFGLTYVFGGDWAVGVRIFHDDEPESAVLALGFDYKFGSQAFRPTIGAAYLDEDFYIDFSLGYDTRLQALDYGVGIGAAFETQKPAAAGGGATTAGTDTTPTTSGTDTGGTATGGGSTDTGTGDSGGGDTGGDTGSDGGDTGTGDGGTDTGGTGGGDTGDTGTGDTGTGDGGTDTGGTGDGDTGTDGTGDGDAGDSVT